jgi:hypothetical protein
MELGKALSTPDMVNAMNGCCEELDEKSMPPWPESMNELYQRSYGCLSACQLLRIEGATCSA